MKEGEKTKERLLAEVAELRRQIVELEQSGADRMRAEVQKETVQALDARKMKAVATLAGGVAHEFNNALLGITLNTDLLVMKLGADDNTRDYVDSIKASARRMADLTNQLLAYAQEGKYLPRRISLSEFLQASPPLIQYTIDPAVQVQTDLQRDLFTVEADLTQMQMVLSAVLTNAVEAIEGHGGIKISTRNEEIDEVFARRHPGLKAGLYACLTVEDDGRGMDGKSLDRIFEPFFTTKFQGRGLGMAAVHGIVKNHGGLVVVDSEVGSGTVVRIYLPAIEEGERFKMKDLVIVSNRGPFGFSEAFLRKTEDFLKAGTAPEPPKFGEGGLVQAMAGLLKTDRWNPIWVGASMGDKDIDVAIGNYSQLFNKIYEQGYAPDTFPYIEIDVIGGYVFDIKNMIFS